MTTQTVYSQVNSRRKSWQAISPSSKEFLKAPKLLSKCLALRVLEMDVKKFILEGLSKPEASIIGEEGINCLMRNTEDEDRHDLALNNCVKILGNYDPQYENEAKLIAKAWELHPDHTIAKAAALENGVFFLMLPLLRRYGSPSVITTAVDISADEVGHVQSHRYAATQMSQKVSKSLDKLRKDTVAWIVDDFNQDNLDINVLMRASDNLMYKGIAPELEFSQSYNVPAFFENRNDSLPYYTM